MERLRALPERPSKSVVPAAITTRRPWIAAVTVVIAATAASVPPRRAGAVPRAGSESARPEQRTAAVSAMKKAGCCSAGRMHGSRASTPSCCRTRGG